MKKKNKKKVIIRRIKAKAPALMKEEPKKRVAMHISDDVLLSSMSSEARRQKIAHQVFAAAQPLPGVVPASEKTIAMDSAIKRAADHFAMALDQQIVFAGGWGGTWGGGGYGAFAEGQIFLGYPYLAELSQRTEYRVIIETIATEMTRKWIKFESAGTIDKTAQIKQIEEEFERLKVQEVFQKIAEDDGYFGRAHLFIDCGVSIDGANVSELQKPIGNGVNEISKLKVKKGTIKRLQPVEAVWTYPTLYNATNPLSPEWYTPSQWFVMGTPVHVSRLLPFIGREVSDILKPAYSFGGLSLSQLVKPYVDNWLRTRQSVSDLLHSFTVFDLATNLAETLTPGGEALFRRAQLFNNLRDNKGLMLTDKETEELNNISVPLSGLDALQAQSQEHMASASRIPLVKLTGISPAGLNASSEGEIRTFYDFISAYQKKFFKPNLDKIFHLAQMNIWGVVDPDISYSFIDLWAMDEKQQAEIRKVNADTGAVLIESGAIDAEEERTRVANEEGTPYASLDLSKVIVPPDQGDENSMFGDLGQGGSLGGSPNDFKAGSAQ